MLLIGSIESIIGETVSEKRSAPHRWNNYYMLGHGHVNIGEKDRPMKLLSGWTVLFVVLGIFLTSCASIKQARRVPIPHRDLLGVDPALFKRGTKIQPLWIYLNPAKKGSDYRAVLMDPVIFQEPPQASQQELDQLQKLVNNMSIYLTREITKEVRVVKEPGPHTLRLQIALFDPTQRPMVTNVLSSVVPVMVAASVAVDLGTGKPLHVGEVSMEVKLTDSDTSELVAAAVDREVGNKYTTKAFNSWGDVDEAMKFWARQVRFRLCRYMRDGAGCLPPK